MYNNFIIMFIKRKYIQLWCQYLQKDSRFLKLEVECIIIPKDNMGDNRWTAFPWIFFFFCGLIRILAKTSQHFSAFSPKKLVISSITITYKSYTYLTYFQLIFYSIYRWFMPLRLIFSMIVIIIKIKISLKKSTDGWVSYKDWSRYRNPVFVYSYLCSPKCPAYSVKIILLNLKGMTN